MIKVKKLSLQNFKGIRGRCVFDFDKDHVNVNVLSGPNGFGKTTLFDVMELCLTGGFKRVEYFDNVQKKTTHRKKPFFQHTDQEDVILKLWLHDSDTTRDYIIIKHYDDDRSPKNKDYARDFIPLDAGNLFFTYLATSPENFTNDNFEQLSLATQAQINSLFYGVDSTADLQSTYYLFNYIQQEDSIFFLRQNEDDKGAYLGFLFNIAREESEKEQLWTLRHTFSAQQTIIQDQITLLKDSLTETQNAEYRKIFPDKDFDFDKEDPFTDIAHARSRLGPYQDILASLILFRNNFSPEEYEKSLKFKKLNEQVITNIKILRAITLRRVYTAELAGQLDAINSKRAKASGFLGTPNNALIQKEYFDIFLTDPEEYAAHQAIEREMIIVNEDLGTVGRLISELNSDRKKIVERLDQLRPAGVISDKNCPVCDTAFETRELLESAINNKTQALEAFNETKLKQKAALEARLNLIHGKILQAATSFIESYSSIEQGVLSLLREYPNLLATIDELIENYPILNSPMMETILFSEAPRTVVELDNRQLALKELLARELLTHLSFSELLIENKQLYGQYFDSDRAKFAAVTTEMITAKSQYLLSAYAKIANTQLAFLEARSQKLSKLLGKISSVYEKVHQTIQQHKVEMIEKIKIPFYIYSGKILQSYQQGLGIFVQIHQTDQSNNVHFKTGHSSDHDIVYHLSSGQMAVVSLAFCLSLNKVYNTNEHFKFLSIDDPIQTMDDLNIHTFIELVRNEFREYQIIMSTHDDFTSRYMKYKFDKFGMNTEIQNVQRIVLEQSLD